MLRLHNQYRFYKEENGWFIDLQEYIDVGGEKGDLAMVLGADDLLDHLSGNGNEITLELALNKEHEYDWDWIMKAENNIAGSGATYVYDTGTKLFVAWLCPVTTFLFDEYPETIYFKTISK